MKLRVCDNCKRIIYRGDKGNLEYFDHSLRDLHTDNKCNIIANSQNPMLSFNDSAKFWRKIGAKTIPVRSKEKDGGKFGKEKWGQYQGKHLPNEVFADWISANKFDEGIAVMMGKLDKGEFEGMYLTCIDTDNILGTFEILSRNTRTSIKKLYIEQHLDDPTRAHVFIITTNPIKTLSLKGTKTKVGSMPAIEIKSTEKNIVVVSPSIHSNGEPYVNTSMLTMPSIQETAQRLLIAITSEYNIEYYT